MNIKGVTFCQFSKKAVIFITAFSFFITSSQPGFALRQAAFMERPALMPFAGKNVRLTGDAQLGELITFDTEGTGSIEIRHGAKIGNGVRLIAKNGEHIVIGRGTELLAGFDTIITGNVSIGENCEVSGRVTDSVIGDNTKLHDRPVVTMAYIGSDCHINGSTVKGYYVPGRGSQIVYDEGDAPINIVIVKNGARIERSTTKTAPEKQSWRLVPRPDSKKKSEELGEFALRHIKVDAKAAVIGARAVINTAYVENANIGEDTIIEPSAVVKHSHIGPRCHITQQASIELSYLEGDNRCGAEVSKSVYGRGVISAHRNAYCSMVAHDVIPLINADGKAELFNLGANCTNIPAGFIFSNHLGKRGPEGKPLKGTAHIFGPSFFASGAGIVNLESSADGADIPLEEIYDHGALTIIGPFCFIKNKTLGVVFPFTKAGEREQRVHAGKINTIPDPSPRFHEIGWVLDNYTGMILDRLMTLKKYADPEAFDHFIEKVLLDGIMRVKKELQNPNSRYDKYKLLRGLEIYEAHLHSGAWKMRNGNFSWGGILEEGQDFVKLEKRIKEIVSDYRQHKREETLKPIKRWIEIFKDWPSSELRDSLIRVYGGDAALITERCQKVYIPALREAARRFGENQEVFIVRSPSRINLCGRGNQDAEDGHMNYLSDDRENIVIGYPRQDDMINLYNATPGYTDRFKGINIDLGTEIHMAQPAFHKGWQYYVRNILIQQRVKTAQSDEEREWMTTPLAIILNLIRDLGETGLFYLNIDIRGFDAVVYSDIPPASGLSSSSALALSCALAFLTASDIEITEEIREILAELFYEVYTGELGGGGDNAIVTLANPGEVLHLSQINSSIRAGKSLRRDSIRLPEDVEVAIVNSFVKSRKTGERKVDNNKSKFSFKLAVPIIRDILKDLKPKYPEIITDDFIRDFRHIGQLLGRVHECALVEPGHPAFLNARAEEFIYEVLSKLPGETTTTELINAAPTDEINTQIYSELKALIAKYSLTRQELKKFWTDSQKGDFKSKTVEEFLAYAEKIDVRGAVMFFLATAERARLVAEYLKNASSAQAGELMNIGHDGDRVVTYFPKTDDMSPYEGQSVSAELLAGLIRDLQQGTGEKRDAARIYRQPGYFRSSIGEIDAIVDVAKSLNKDGNKVVLGAALFGAGFGGNVVVLLKKQKGRDLIKELNEALEKVPMLQKARTDASQPFAKLNRPVLGASVFEAPLSAEDMYKQALRHYQNGEVKKAIEKTREAISRDPRYRGIADDLDDNDLYDIISSQAAQTTIVSTGCFMRHLVYEIQPPAGWTRERLDTYLRERYGIGLNNLRLLDSATKESVEVIRQINEDLAMWGFKGQPRRGFGGLAFNTSRVLRQLSGRPLAPDGKDPFIVKAFGRVGDDLAAQDIRDELTVRWGVDTTGLQPGRLPTSITHVLSFREFGRMFFQMRNANTELEMINIPDEAIRQAAVLHIGGSVLTPKLMEKLPEFLKKAKTINPGIKIVVDTTGDQHKDWNRVFDLNPRAYQYIDMLATSFAEREAIQIAGASAPDEILDFFIKKGVGAVFLKKGAEGSYVATQKGEKFHCPALKGLQKGAIRWDETGAGDSYTAGLIYGARHGWDIKKTALLATVLGGITCGYFGGSIETENIVNAVYHMRRLKGQIGQLKIERPLEGALCAV